MMQFKPLLYGSVGLFVVAGIALLLPSQKGKGMPRLAVVSIILQYFGMKNSMWSVLHDHSVFCCIAPIINKRMKRLQRVLDLFAVSSCSRALRSNNNQKGIM